MIKDRICNLLLLFSIVFFTGCKKETGQRHQIKGVVINSVSRQPVAGQRVELTVIMQKTVKTNDPEWPDGKPEFHYTKYQTSSDQAGQYLFDVKIPNLPWSYNVIVPTGEFIVSRSPLHFFPIDENFLSLQPDSIFIEKPGYVRYSIKTSGAANNEMLYVSTPHHTRKIWPGYIIVVDAYYNNYDWAFEGKTDKIIIDTIPAETIPDPEIEWLRISRSIISTDTLMLKREKIQVQPGSTVNYSIQY